MTSSIASVLIVVDTHVDDYPSLIQGTFANADVIILDPHQDGVEQISRTLSQYKGLTSVQIISHGHEGSLQLGSVSLNATNVERYGSQLQQWSTALADQAEVLLYGCHVAAGMVGQAFVRRLSQIVNATIAASTTLTGNATKGGNWDLDFATGAITSQLAIHPTALEAYPSVLKDFNVNSYDSLREAILEANSNSEDDTIRFNSDIDLSGELPTISSNIEFIGNNYKISGADIYRVFAVDGSTTKVRFTNLTIEKGRAQGGDGTDQTTAQGGHAGNGLGGGLLVTNGDITLVNVTFDGNRAVGGEGGESIGSAGGNGGNGHGGAVYVAAGSLRISNTSFNNNIATGGLGGVGASNNNGQQGQGKGGGIYVASGATVIAERNPRYIGNDASSDLNIAGDDNNVFGSVTIVIPPTSLSIARAQSQITADATVSYIVTFDQDVTGVDPADFNLVTTGAIANASIASVSGSGKTYTVEVNTGTGNGDLRLDLKDDDSIKNGASVPLGATGTGNGAKTGQTYTINKTPPDVFSIDRKTAVLTAADALTYVVNFTQDVTGVDTGDFALVSNGIQGASISSVKKLSDRSYEVIVNSGTGNGQLGLNLVDNDSIRNLRQVVLGGTGTGNGNFTGQAYTIDKTAPLVSSIQRANPNPTNARTVNYTVVFSQNVTGVDGTDFRLVSGGAVRGAGISSVTQVDAKTYTVAVNTGSGDGSIRLDLRDNDSIKNTLGVVLGGRGEANGNFTWASYNLLKDSPRVSAVTLVNPNPTAASNVNYAVTFNQDVAGVDVSDFGVTAVGLTGSRVTSVTGSGRNYNVQVSTGSGSGTIALNVRDDDSIRNAVGAVLGGRGAGNGNFTGQSYTINKAAPRVTAINRLETNPTNAATVTFTAIFNENVLRVDPADFALATNGVTGANIASITRVNGSFYTIQVNTGRGNGTIGLNLVDNDSILNRLGTPLGGAGRGNGNFIGEVYRVDKASPTVRIVDVSPDPRRDKVNAITIDFNEAIQGFDITDLQLTRNGQQVNLSQATLTSDGGITWTLGNIKKLTNQKGDYVLSLAAGDSGITDAARNPLTQNVIESWTNLETVDACDPGIFRRGTEAADFLVGTEDEDTLLGSDGNDVLIGLECGDRLVGGSGKDSLDGGEGKDFLVGGTGNDILNGGIGQDTLKGGPGKDRFVFAGATQAEALSTSTVDAPDRVQDFKFSAKDKFQLDFDNNPRTRNRPRGLFNAGNVGGRTLGNAVRDAYADKNQDASGNQRLRGNEAVFFEWKNRTYLSVNNNSAGFAANRDLVVEVTGIQFKPGDANAGVLAVGNYFI